MNENPLYLTDQLITYIGNKRALLDFIQTGIDLVLEKTGKKKLVTFDVFSGSGIVSRYLKKYSSVQYTNDLEDYAKIISECYLANIKNIDYEKICSTAQSLHGQTEERIKHFLSKDYSAFKNTEKLPGFVSKFYAPKNALEIKEGERCFYTPYNAAYLDIARTLIETQISEQERKFYIAPLLSEASIHANTGGVFKGFYKNSRTGCGKFGGNGENALSRIQGHISLKPPVLSNFKSKAVILQGNANSVIQDPQLPQVDLAYIDPPYNQHPYGSNYFMLNLISSYKSPSPELMSKVSGIPKNWNRSSYNKKKAVTETFSELVKNLKARFLMVSFNNEGFISQKEMTDILSAVGKVTVLESPYNAYRASRNLNARSIHVKEFLYIVEKF